MTAGSLLLVVSLLTSPGAAQPDQSADRVVGARTQSDQTVQVPKGTRVEVDDCSGDLIVQTWERDAVRVQARHTSRTRVRAELVGTMLRIDVDAERGPGSADINLSVPSWINLRVNGNNCFAEVAGVSGTVSVDTVEGDILLTGLTGTVNAESVSGKITLEGGRGRVELSTVEGDIVVSKAGGEIVAESVEGNITVTDAQATAVEISTVDGNISYGGALQTSGRYLFTTHDGDVTLTIPDNSSATFSVRTFGDGRLDSSLPLKQGTAGRRGQRATYTLGGGSAQVDIEAFDGSVRIRRIGEKD
jgi:DUF4097 and DUF4098 domain-containing protein YvlB